LIWTKKAFDQSGNPGGRRKTTEFLDALRMEIAALKEGDRRGMRVVARRLVEQALKGNMLALKEIAERHDGKVAQATILQGDAEAPVRYVEVPRKAANADEWLQMQTPARASAEGGSDKFN
jgi:Family of unknown function (DUF5681)